MQYCLLVKFFIYCKLLLFVKYLLFVKFIIVCIICKKICKNYKDYYRLSQEYKN